MSPESEPAGEGAPCFPRLSRRDVITLTGSLFDQIKQGQSDRWVGRIQAGV